MPRKEENLPTCYKCQTQLPNCWIEDFESFGKKTRMPNLFAKLLELLAHTKQGNPDSSEHGTFSGLLESNPVLKEMVCPYQTRQPRYTNINLYFQIWGKVLSLGPCLVLKKFYKIF